MMMIMKHLLVMLLNTFEYCRPASELAQCLTDEQALARSSLIFGYEYVKSEMYMYYNNIFVNGKAT